MNNSYWDDVLQTAAEDVLETMFFTAICGPADGALRGAAPRWAARVAFEGAPRGSLTLGLADSSAQSLASNFLALESGDPVPPAPLAHVVCELANMICGALLSRVESETNFRLSHPQLLAPDGPLGLPNRSLALGDGTLDLWLQLENHAR